MAYGAPVYKYDPKQARYPVPLGLAVEYGGDLDNINILTKAHNHKKMQYTSPYALSVVTTSGNMSAAQYLIRESIQTCLTEERGVTQSAMLLMIAIRIWFVSYLKMASNLIPRQTLYYVHSPWLLARSIMWCFSADVPLLSIAVLSLTIAVVQELG